MADTICEKTPLGLPYSSGLVYENDTPMIRATAVAQDFEWNGTFEELSAGPSEHSPRSPNTPNTPATPNFERKSLLKRMTGTYQPTTEELEADPLERLRGQDTYLKQHIRRLKVISRLVAACLSIAVLVPLAITTHKYLSTRNTYRGVTNESAGASPVRRTAWANETVTWPTYMYFGIAVVSLIFNTTVMFSYLHGVKAANTIACVGGFFTSGVLVLNLVIWVVTTALYKQQSVVTNDRGVHNDLWGWTCSPAARLLQPVFDEQVNFGKYCDIQAVSFYIGLVQVGAVVFTIVLYGFVLRRARSKKEVRKSMTARQSSG